MDRERESRRAGWRLIGGALRSQTRWVVGGVLSGVVWTAAKITIPLLAAAAIDQGILPGDTEAIVMYSVLIVLVGAVQAFGTGARRYAAFRISYRVETDLRQRLFAHLQQLHFAFHDQAQTGQLMARANTDIQQVNQVVVLLPLFAASLFIVVAVIVVMMSKSVTLAFLALGALPLLNVAATRFSHRIAPISLKLQQELGDLSGVVEETVAGVRVVKGFGSERLQAERLEAEADDVLDQALKAAWLRAGFLPLIDFLPALALVAILWYGGHLVLDGDLQLGDLVAFNSFILMLIWPLRMTGMLVAQASRASSSAGRIHEILATDPEVVDPPNPVALPPRLVEGAGALSSGADRPGRSTPARLVEGASALSSGADRPGRSTPARLVEGASALSSGAAFGELRFEGVTFAYGDGPRVLDDLDLVVRGGEAVAVVGSTGSGKTTLARLISRFYDVNDGRVLVDGVDVRDLRVGDLRRDVGIVFEDTFLFTDTVAENIAFADPEASMEQVRRAAALAGAAEFIDALPAGYDTVIGEHGFSLSGGQRQRIAIARAVLADPRVLILDDATSSVDPTKEHEIRAALREVMDGRTTVIIAHRAATIALADRVVLLDGGKIVVEGTHDELLATSDRYRAVLAQAERSASASVPADGLGYPEPERARQ